jgi:2-polyprenyl-3-methyl-5-hydroxy-6-metoxy-1,4-benzoquinol methylase
MMFGYRDTFTYFECPACGCLQIAEIPSDMGRFYPSHYYSFTPMRPVPSAASLARRVRRYTKRARDRYAAVGEGLLGRAVALVFDDSPLARDVSSHFAGQRLSSLGVRESSRILDVGCGGGVFLSMLHEIGFRNLLGVDPHLSCDSEPRPALRIRKATIHDLAGTWDVITFHHSLEHIPDQDETLCSAFRLLAERGLCLVRIPTTSSVAWERYREHWVQLDAPRHFFLHSVRSLTAVAERAGFVVDDVVYDSTGFQFWGSEQYRRDFPLRARSPEGGNPDPALFSDGDLQAFERRARELNVLGRGDQAAFFLRKRDHRPARSPGVQPR